MIKMNDFNKQEKHGLKRELAAQDPPIAFDPTTSKYLFCVTVQCFAVNVPEIDRRIAIDGEKTAVWITLPS